MTDNDCALLIVDVQNDFCEGGSLAVEGGAAAAGYITDHLRRHRRDYKLVVASRDVHNPDSNNGGHFAEPGTDPNYDTTWPAHCVAHTPGAEYHPALSTWLIDRHIRKGWNAPAYSMFQGYDNFGHPLTHILNAEGITKVEVCGIATDYCVYQTCLSALNEGMDVTLLLSLCVGVAPATSRLARTDLSRRGVHLVANAA